MNKEVLLRTYEDFIEGYGFLTDLWAETIYGIPNKEAVNYYEWRIEFLPYSPSRYYELNQYPYSKIRKGSLLVFAKKVEMDYQI
jgi:hypothetical protein